MKKKIKTALVILAAAFFMAGCGGESTEDLTDSELKEFTNWFDSNGELFGFLLPEYESPEEIRWDRVVAYRWNYYISYKATGNGEYLTDEEKMEFYGTTEKQVFWEDSVIRRSKLAEYIKRHTGLDYCPEPEDVPCWKYNEKYDCYLVSANLWETYSPMFGGEFVSGTKTGNLYELRYRPDNEDWPNALHAMDRIITFEKSDDDILIKSNRFVEDGQGKRISGTDPSVYDELIRDIGEAIKSRENKSIYDGGVVPNGLSDALRYGMNSEDSSIGYCKKDIDGDGVCELLIGICDLKEPDDHKVDYDEIYDMYTVIDGEFKHVFSAFSERYRYYLCENGAIAHENSTSAADSLWFFYRYHGGKLDFIEGLYTALRSEDDSMRYCMFYRKDGAEEYEVTDPNVEIGSFDSLDFAKYKYQKIDYTPFAE